MTIFTHDNPAIFHGDQAALRAALSPDVALCTIARLEGSFSRRIGAQLAIGPMGVVAGSLADNCLEDQLVSEVAKARRAGTAQLVRFGADSSNIDFRLPCGGGLDILIDPAPDRDAIAAAVARLDTRCVADLPLSPAVEAASGLLKTRHYIPRLRLVILGEGPEVRALARLATVAGVEVESLARQDGKGAGGLALGVAPRDLAVDSWSALILLFHDHEWERAILDWALSTPAFYIGAQGGLPAREARRAVLLEKGYDADAIARVRSPVGLIERARDPAVLALSVLAEIVGEYERIHPHG